MLIHSIISACCFTMECCSRYTFGKPVTGKLTVNMTVNGVGYYRHEMGQPVVKSMDVSITTSAPSLCIRGCVCVYGSG